MSSKRQYNKEIAHNSDDTSATNDLNSLSSENKSTSTTRSKQLLDAKRLIFSSNLQPKAKPKPTSSQLPASSTSAAFVSSSSIQASTNALLVGDEESGYGISQGHGRKLTTNSKHSHSTVTRSLVPRSRSDARNDVAIEKAAMLKQRQNQIQSSVAWKFIVYGTTWLLPTFLLKRLLGTKDWKVCFAWREKFAWCFVILVLCLMVAFITFGFTTLVCDNANSIYTYSFFNKTCREKKDQWFLAHGKIYSPFSKKNTVPINPAEYEPFVGLDVSGLFPYAPSCERIGIDSMLFPCEAGNGFLGECLNIGMLNGIHSVANVAFQWKDMENSNRFVYSGKVYDITKYLRMFPPNADGFLFGSEIDQILRTSLRKDATKRMSKIRGDIRACMDEMFMVGRLDVKTMGCLATEIVLWVSLIVILSVILIRFVLACWYSWFIARRLGRAKLCNSNTTTSATSISSQSLTNSTQMKRSRSGISTKYSKNRQSLQLSTSTPNQMSSSLNSIDSRSIGTPSMIMDNASCTGGDESDMLVILLVTCYSEGEASIRTTIDSLASTSYPDSQKLLFIIADGIIKGAGNAQATPDTILSMMDPYESEDPVPVSCLALAEGSKRLNMAKVYCGTYTSLDKSHRVPMTVVVKVGTPEESTLAKPGNRGKRDSQIILMSFLSKSLFDDRMTPLEYELHKQIRHYHGVNPASFESVLMVDADTFVLPDSLPKMVATLCTDEKIMGMCGETQIANKGASWVTAIQVYEYYISHHLAKSFESVFGGVTCLPGCFCMYRIKGRRHDGWVPLLANPDIVSQYSENRTDTLHRKNLLLLGEDRYLTTLMLKTFTRRKLIFLPAAKCRTFVPDKFSILLSQRRRWINSTIHNLLELVMVRDLCGTFCFSMQFVVFMELVGSLVLPAAIVFTGVLVVTAILGSPQVIPLILLAAILGLPAVLILFTTKEIGYLMWLIIYLLSLPIWNFILPLYAFWHFDDFSWGQTRQLEGNGGIKHLDGHGDTSGHFDYTMISMKRWSEYDEMYSRIEQEQEQEEGEDEQGIISNNNVVA